MSTRPNWSKVANEKMMWMDGQETNRNDESIQFHCTIKHETRKAVLIIVDDKEIWLPKSMVQLDMVGDDTAILSIPEWLAKKHRLA
jgi:hypothetical protein